MLSLAAAEPAPAAPLDYSQAAHWLCLPGQSDLCAVDLTTTVVQPNGELRVEPHEPAANPAIDCFYAYPTVSMDPMGNSDVVIGNEERAVIRAQFARFGAVCRTFAPLYRQVTLTALRAGMSGQPMAADRELAYADVRAAWHQYLAHHSAGRGVVLIGHSQGAGILTRLIRDEIDGKPLAARLVSALLLGTALPVANDRDVGGAFQHVPLCGSARQVGCAVAFASFRDTVPPPPDSRFTRVLDATGAPVAGQRTACVNPAALLAATPAARRPLRAYFSAGQAANLIPVPDVAWVRDAPAIATPFVSAPGLVSGQCVANSHGHYLEVVVHGDAADTRIDDIPGDVRIGGAVQASWGLHLIDVHLLMGDLLNLVRGQADAYHATQG